MNVESQDVLLIAQGLIILVLSVAVHEFGHALAGHLLGDDTPERQGRLTLNPIAHADPIGTLLLPLMVMVYSASRGLPIGAGFGWGKPVQTQPRNYTRKLRMVTGQALVAIAGPMMNVLLGTVVAIIHVVLLSQGVISVGHPVSDGLLFASSLNFTLFFFNLLPAAPLDGGYVLEWVTPYRHRDLLEKYKVYSPFVVMAVFAIPQIRVIITVPADFVLDHLYSLLISIFGPPVR